MISLSDFQPIFLYEFKFNQSAVDTVRKLTRHLAMIVLMNALFDVGLRHFVPEILASKMCSKYSTYSNPGRGLEDPGGDWPITNGAWDGERTGRQLPCGFWWFKTYWKGQKARNRSRFERSTEIVTFWGLFFFAFAQPKRSFLNPIVTCDKKWVLYDNRRRSKQWLDTDEPPKHFLKTKTMVTVW